MPCVPLRDDAARQMRIPIAANACQCDEDWHPGKLSLKLVFSVPYQSNDPGDTQKCLELKESECSS